MRVRHNNGQNFWYDRDLIVVPLEVKVPVIVVVDQSKKNTAVIIGSTTGVVFDIIETSGSDPKFYHKAGDTTEYCLETEMYMTQRLKYCKVLKVYSEKTILKKKFGDKSSGMDHYKTNLILNEIRSSWLRIGELLTGESTFEINNVAWKSLVLPDGYRGHKEKGSYRYWSAQDPKWLDYSDDVTDAFSMYVYAMVMYHKNEGLLCDKREQLSENTRMSLVDAKNLNVFQSPNFTFNQMYTLEENAAYVASRVTGIGICTVKMELLSIADIAKYGNYLTPESKVCMVVYKRQGE